uniref:Condensin complex subunit 1 N-terminal domain-containing protein n=1 Tax=Ciona savignyi TaxID=51511 RepID=H2ZI75_CIOSA
MNIFDLDIHRLWNTQLVEDELTCLVANICYKVLEDPVLIKSKLVKPAVFHLLGCIIRKHNQSLGASLKLVQMLQHFEHLALPVAEAVQLWVVTYKCKSLVSEILRELDHIPEKEFMRDGASTKTICSFILELARLLPDAVLINISLLLTRMDEESYLMRNSVLSVIGEIIMQCLSKEGLDNQAKQARDQFLDILYDHANLDVNAFVRSRALHIWLNLVSQEHLPVKRCSELAELCVRLLLDKSNLVRKV